MSTPTYVLNYKTFAVTSEADGHYVLCVCIHLWPFVSQRLIHWWLCLSPLVVKVQLSQLIYLNWEGGYGWVWVGHSPQNKHPNPPTPGPTQILAGFKFFLVMSEPCALPAYQKRDSTQATPPLCLDYGTVSASIIRNISITSPSNTGLGDKSSLSLIELYPGQGFFQHSDF